MTDTSVSHEDRFALTYAQKLTATQTEHARAFVDTAHDQALLDYILQIQGRPAPTEAFDLEESPDMPVKYMGSSPAALQFLQTLVLLKQPKTLVEIGTFVGLSAIYMAEKMPADGRIFSFEYYDSFAAIARRNLDKYTRPRQVEITVGDAKETLGPKLGKIGPVDMAFVDGDKGAYADYFRLLDPHVPVGGMLVFDDMVFHGDALNTTPTTDKGAGVKEMAALAAEQTGYHRTLLPVANGLLLMIKTG